MYLQDDLKNTFFAQYQIVRETLHFARSFFTGNSPICRLFISYFSVSYPLMPVIRSSAASFNSIAFLSYKSGYHYFQFYLCTILAFSHLQIWNLDLFFWKMHLDIRDHIFIIRTGHLKKTPYGFCRKERGSVKDLLDRYYQYTGANAIPYFPAPTAIPTPAVVHSPAAVVRPLTVLLRTKRSHLHPGNLHRIRSVPPREESTFSTS